MTRVKCKESKERKRETWYFHKLTAARNKTSIDTQIALNRRRLLHVTITKSVYRRHYLLRSRRDLVGSVQKLWEEIKLPSKVSQKICCSESTLNFSHLAIYV